MEIVEIFEFSTIDLLGELHQLALNSDFYVLGMLIKTSCKAQIGRGSLSKPMVLSSKIAMISVENLR